MLKCATFRLGAGVCSGATSHMNRYRTTGKSVTPTIGVNPNRRNYVLISNAFAQAAPAAGGMDLFGLLPLILMFVLLSSC